ncbi:retropepsin-like aspartic protease family protein [Singulisphaera rosea]
MTPTSRLSSFGMLLTLALTIAPAVLGADDPADSALKEKGLKKSGNYLVLSSEATTQKKLNETKARYKQYSLAVMQQRQFDRGVEDSKAYLRQLIEQRRILGLQLKQARSTDEHNQIVTMLNDTNDQMKLLEDEESDPKFKDNLNANAAQSREQFVQAVIDLRQLIDETQKQYTELSEDETVKESLAALNKKGKTKYSLGPSKAFLANVKLVEKVEASVLSESVTMRRDNGVFWLDVTFNGKVTEPMVFDTGASIVVLSSELASKIGLKPSSSDPTIECHIADGSVVEAKKMSIPSVRVGKFTIKDVECAVMPPTKRELSPLLGGSFNKYFDYKVIPETGKLILSKVETEASESKPAPKAKSGRTVRGRR